MESEEVREIVTTLVRESESWPAGFRSLIPHTLEQVLVFPEHAASLLGDEGAQERFDYMSTVTSLSGARIIPRVSDGQFPATIFTSLFTVPEVTLRELEGDTDILDLHGEIAGINETARYRHFNAKEALRVLLHVGMGTDPQRRANQVGAVRVALALYQKYLAYYRSNVQELGNPRQVVPQQIEAYRRAQEIRTLLLDLSNAASQLPLPLAQAVYDSLITDAA